IAYVNERRTLRHFAPESPAKQNEFIDIGQPLRRGCAKSVDSSKHRRRTNEIRFNSASAQSLQHHLVEAQHALLLIGQVITDQQYHCLDRFRPVAHEAGSHSWTGGESVLDGDWSIRSIKPPVAPLFSTFASTPGTIRFAP